MADPVNFGDLRDRLGSFAGGDDAFTILKEIANLIVGNDRDDEDGRELVIRALDKGDVWGECRPVLNALVRQVGLFPYLGEGPDVGIADLLAFEVHRPLGSLGEQDVVFHRAQGWVYRELLGGENVILSAPTSFGKSLITDALITSGRFRNCVVVVPTIALIDETRRRLATTAPTFKLITHPSQQLGEKNLFILTQERVIDFPEFPFIDFFVIDEFYKLDPRGGDTQRSNILNQAFYRLWKLGGQFYFLGPNIESLDSSLPSNFNYKFIRTDFSTVAFDVERLSVAKGDEPEVLVNTCRTLAGPTLIYCRSPKRTRDVATWLLDGGIGREAGVSGGAVEWMRSNFHPEWLVAKAFSKGIGIHHGRLPRSISQYMVRAFNSGKLDYLICTSTLIEGVNTRAKNVVIFDNQIARQKFDYFTFNNIKGRSGRMFEHFTGHVFLFHDPPREALPEVEFPILSQPESAPESMLVQLDPADMSAESRARLAYVLEQSDLSLTTIRANSGVDPERQIDLAKEIRNRIGFYSQALRWTYPTYDQLKVVCDLIWKYLTDQNSRVGGAFSAAQLTFKINQLSRTKGDLRTLIEAEMTSGYGSAEPDDAVEDVLDFVRGWAGFTFPNALRSLDRIQHEVLSAESYPPGNYSLYAAKVESLFLPFPLVALEEYGLPIQVSKKLVSHLAVSDENLDAALDALKGLASSSVRLSDFEREMIRFAQEGL